MRAINNQFTDLVDGKKQFIIPVFQRDYSWTKEQCDQLWNDVLRASRSEENSGHLWVQLCT